MPSRNDEIRYLQDGAEEIERFILSKAIYGPAAGSGGASLSQLSLGGLLLVQKRLSGFNLSQSQQNQVGAANQQIAAARERWREHWGRKASQELGQRLPLWSAYLLDYLQDPEEYYPEYPQRVRWRVMLQLLERETADPQYEVQHNLHNLDESLRSAWIPGEFVWESEIAGVFPQNEFWYLYGNLKTTRP